MLNNNENILNNSKKQRNYMRPNFQGATGPQGMQGPEGPEGYLGEHGSAGLTGIQGIRGLHGLQGPMGPTGPTGPTGPQGIEGPQGLMGPQGIQGMHGENGKDGVGITILEKFKTLDELKIKHPIGALGDSYLVGGNLHVWDITKNNWDDVGAVQGPMGPTGPQGVTGPQGPMGPQGNKGNQGSIGPNGIPGIKGATGPRRKIENYLIVQNTENETIPVLTYHSVKFSKSSIKKGNNIKHTVGDTKIYLEGGYRYYIYMSINGAPSSNYGSVTGINYNGKAYGIESNRTGNYNSSTVSAVIYTEIGQENIIELVTNSVNRVNAELCIIELEKVI